MTKARKQDGLHGELTVTRLNSIKEYKHADYDMAYFSRYLGATGLLKIALLQARCWDHTPGSYNIDNHIKIWIRKDSRSLMTSNLFNRLLKLLYKRHGEPVMVLFILLGKEDELLFQKDHYHKVSTFDQL